MRLPTELRARARNAREITRRPCVHCVSTCNRASESEFSCAARGTSANLSGWTCRVDKIIWASAEMLVIAFVLGSPAFCPEASCAPHRAMRRLEGASGIRRLGLPTLERRHYGQSLSGPTRGSHHKGQFSHQQSEFRCLRRLTHRRLVSPL